MGAGTTAGRRLVRIFSGVGLCTSPNPRVLCWSCLLLPESLTLAFFRDYFEDFICYRPLFLLLLG